MTALAALKSAFFEVSNHRCKGKICNAVVAVMAGPVKQNICYLVYVGMSWDCDTLGLHTKHLESATGLCCVSSREGSDFGYVSLLC